MDEFEFYGQVWETKDLNEYWGRPEDIDESIDTISFKVKFHIIKL